MFLYLVVHLHAYNSPIRVEVLLGCESSRIIGYICNGSSVLKDLLYLLNFLLLAGEQRAW